MKSSFKRRPRTGLSDVIPEESDSSLTLTSSSLDDGESMHSDRNLQLHTKPCPTELKLHTSATEENLAEKQASVDSKRRSSVTFQCKPITRSSTMFNNSAAESAIETGNMNNSSNKTPDASTSKRRVQKDTINPERQARTSTGAIGVNGIPRLPAEPDAPGTVHAARTPRTDPAPRTAAKQRAPSSARQAETSRVSVAFRSSKTFSRIVTPQGAGTSRSAKASRGASRRTSFKARADVIPRTPVTPHTAVTTRTPVTPRTAVTTRTPVTPHSPVTPRTPKADNEKTFLDENMQKLFEELNKLKLRRLLKRSHMTLLSPTMDEIHDALSGPYEGDIGDIPQLRLASRPPTPSPTESLSFEDITVSTNFLTQLQFDPTGLMRTDPTIARVAVDTLRDYTQEDETVLKKVVLVLCDDMLSNQEATSMLKAIFLDQNYFNKGVYGAIEYLISKTKDPTQITDAQQKFNKRISHSMARAKKATEFLEKALNRPHVSTTSFESGSSFASTSPATRRRTSIVKGRKGSRVSIIKQARPSQGEIDKQSRPSQAEISQESRRSHAEISKSSRPSQAEISQKSRRSHAEISKSSRPSQAEISKQYRRSQTEIRQESRPDQAETSKQAIPSQADISSIKTEISKEAAPRQTKISKQPSSVGIKKPSTSPKALKKQPGPSQTKISKQRSPSPVLVTMQDEPRQTKISRQPITAVSEQPSPSPALRSQQTSPVPVARSMEPISVMKSRQASPSLAERSKQAGPSPALKSKPTSPSPAVKSRPASPSPAVKSKAASPSPKVESRPASPIPGVKSRQASPSPAVRSKQVSPSPAVKSRPASSSTKVKRRPASPSPAVQSRQASPSPAERSKQTTPRPAVQSRQASPSPAERSKQTTPRPAVQSRQASPSLAEKSKQTTPRPAVQSRQASPSLVEKSKQTTPRPAVQSRQASPSLAEKSKQTTPRPAVQSRKASPSFAERGSQTTPRSAVQSRQASPSLAERSRSKQTTPRPAEKSQRASPRPAEGIAMPSRRGSQVVSGRIDPTVADTSVPVDGSVVIEITAERAPSVTFRMPEQIEVFSTGSKDDLFIRQSRSTVEHDLDVPKERAQFKSFVVADSEVPRIPIGEKTARTGNLNKFDFFTQMGWFFENVELDQGFVDKAKQAMPVLIAAASTRTPDGEPEDTEETLEKTPKRTPKRSQAGSLPGTTAVQSIIDMIVPPSSTAMTESSVASPQSVGTAASSLKDYKSQTSKASRIRKKSNRIEAHTTKVKKAQKTVAQWERSLTPHTMTTLPDETDLALNIIDRIGRRRGTDIGLPDLGTTGTSGMVTPAGSGPLKKIVLPPLIPGSRDKTAPSSAGPGSRQVTAPASAGSKSRQATPHVSAGPGSRQAIAHMSAGPGSRQATAPASVGPGSRQKTPLPSIGLEWGPEIFEEMDLSAPTPKSKAKFLPRISVGEPEGDTQPESLDEYLSRQRIRELLGDLLAYLILTEPPNPLDVLIDKVRHLKSFKSLKASVLDELGKHELMHQL